MRVLTLTQPVTSALLIPLLLCACPRRSLEPSAAGLPAVEAAPPQPPTDALRPLEAEECTALADALGQRLGLVGTRSEAEIRDFSTDQDGTGCGVHFEPASTSFDDLPALEEAARTMLEERGWYQDKRLAADGPGSTVTGLRNHEDGLCMVSASVEPMDMSLCPGDEPLFTCMDRLPPEQIRYQLGLNCAQGSQHPPPAG